MKVWKTILAIFFIIFVVAIIWIYWFTGFSKVSLSPGSQNSNFSLDVSNSNMQFYDNMRYSDSKISYRISDKCTLQKKADAEGAFDILENETILDFYAVQGNEEILISCESKQRTEEEFFVAGEGGPVNITKAGEFNVIMYGEVSLIRQSECMYPNIAIHEILHALGFDHSANPNNIMYNVSKCSQTIGEDIPNLISQIYSVTSKPDLILDEVSPNIHGKYLDVNISVRNNGLKDSGEAVINIYAGDNLVHTIDVQPLVVGFGMKFMLQNVQIGSGFDELRFIAESDFEELDKANNEIVFSVEK